jgi:hypothetical protein
MHCPSPIAPQTAPLEELELAGPDELELEGPLIVVVEPPPDPAGPASNA